MARIKHRGAVPRGGQWYYRDPHSGQEFRHYQFDGLLDRVRRHRLDNGYPLGLEFEKEVEEQVCINHPDECLEVPENVPYKTNLTLSDVIRGSSVMMQFYARGKPLVDRAEAERRAQVCLRCPLNDDFSRPCAVGICKELKAVVGAIINNVGTQYDSKLRSCRICHCFLMASIWLPLDLQCGVVTDSMKKQFQYAKEHYGCWKMCE